MVLPSFFHPCHNISPFMNFAYTETVRPARVFIFLRPRPNILTPYLIEPLVPSTMYFWAMMNMMIGGMIMMIVIQSIGMICVS